MTTGINSHGFERLVEPDVPREFSSRVMARIAREGRQPATERERAPGDRISWALVAGGIMLATGLWVVAGPRFGWVLNMSFTRVRPSVTVIDLTAILGWLTGLLAYGLGLWRISSKWDAWDY